MLDAVWLFFARFTAVIPLPNYSSHDFGKIDPVFSH